MVWQQEVLTEGVNLTQQILSTHLEQAHLLAELSDQPLVVARLAHRLGELELARALLARSGGLFDPAESQRIFTEACPDELVARAFQVVQKRAPLGRWTDTQREMYVRVLASLLVSDHPPDSQSLSGSVGDWPAGLWRFPAQPEQHRWAEGVHLVRQTTARGQWACASWGGRWGLRRTLKEAGLSGQVELISLEHVLNALSAAWLWDLPELAQLLTRPLLIEGLENLSPERFDLLSGLLSDAVALFGWTVVALPRFELPWPAEYAPLPGVPGEAASALPPTPPVILLPPQQPVSLGQVAEELREQRGRSLVVLYSRASAARLAGMLPGSVLLSSSLCRVHLAQRMTEVLEQQGEKGPLTVIATTLPSIPFGLFDRVWHLNAPLPHLVEAAELCQGTFRVLHLSDVGVPQPWARQLQVTDAKMAQGDALADRELQREYAEELRALEHTSRALSWLDMRRGMQFASLASELNAQPNTSLPVLIPFDQEGQQVIARYRQERWLPRHDLRYAAWLTGSEARRAVQRGEAEQVGWALIWHGRYDPVYGLAWQHVQQGQYQD